MAKLIEKLRDVAQASGGGMGFFGRSQGSVRPARPAAVFVVGGKGDLPALMAGAEAGADGVIVSGWNAGGDVPAGLVDALRARDGIWGVEFDGEATADMLKAAKAKGADFAVLGPSQPAGVLFEELDRFDRVLVVEPPRDDMALLTQRAVNLLPAQAALIQLSINAAALGKLSIADFTRLQFFWESLRFPSLAALRGVPDAAAVRLLVQLGADGLVLSAAGTAASALGEQVKALLSALEKTPARREHDSGALLAGLFSPPAQPAAPSRRPDKPEPEPDEE